ncbi:expressed unknown protein [Seminavis robusta]|uniref:Uncharacterized protein n=1 Tax=Seminavis robusta TaxID=568900 RepID=A0A9N8H9U9_9STRA|nr:expressed unknown protein [Seminavis robusta]|eukprot:Sro218_g090170.1 n/a (390) ;mRNA; r:65994-67163
MLHPRGILYNGFVMLSYCMATFRLLETYLEQHVQLDPMEHSVPAASLSLSSASINCSLPENSLHQVALDMIRHSSPKGSPSYQKLQHVLHQNQYFYIDLGPRIFGQIQNSIIDMLRGYGLTRVYHYNANVTLVETMFTKSKCPIDNKHNNCANTQHQARIYIQSEQYLKDHLGSCHDSPHCIALEFSDHNYKLEQEKGWGDSVVLLPVMTQQPSRLIKYAQYPLQPLQKRTTDVVFFGLMTNRRRILQQHARRYTQQQRPGANVTISKVNPKTEQQYMANAYQQAKVCLVGHSYSNVSGGEYHRLSEFAPFGCIPVMETFADVIGVDRYQACGKVTFAPLDQLFDAAANIIAGQIDRGTEYYNFDNFDHVAWWREGIHWGSILTTMYAD